MSSGNILFVLFCALMAAGASSVSAEGAREQAASRVHVEYVHPEKFTDVGDRYNSGDKLRSYYLGDIQRHIEQRAKRYLPEDRNLTVSISDIDMAGAFEWWRGPRFDHVRIVRDIYPPRIKLRFTVTDATGKLIAGGRRELSNINFLSSIGFYRDDPLKHEKNLLDEWMRRDLLADRGRSRLSADARRAE